MQHVSDAMKEVCRFISVKQLTTYTTSYRAVWYDALFLKLRRAKIGGPFYNILKGMYQKTRSVIKYDGHASEEFEVHRTRGRAMC